MKQILHRIDVLSPNAEEALGLLSIDKAGVDDPSVIEFAAAQFLSFGIGKHASGYVIIRCGAMGAYAATLEADIVKGWWTPAYWRPEDKDAVVDVTGKAGGSESDSTFPDASARCRECVSRWTVGWASFIEWECA